MSDDLQAKRPRILFVAMTDSIHTARYVEVLTRAGWDIHLFPVYYCEPHEKMRNVTVWNGATSYRPPEVDPSVTLKGAWPFRRGRFLGVLAGRLANRLGFDAAARLAWVIDRIKPDIVHSLEFQLAGYLVDTARQRATGKRFPLWIATNWGSDIYAFGRLPEHEERIRGLLSRADVYACECFRDVLLARDMGFKGDVLPVVPNTGGFDLEHCRTLRGVEPPSKRKVIAVKGYQYSLGRSLVALRALERVAHRLRDYRIVVYSPYPREVVEVPARLMAQRSGLAVELLFKVPHEEILKLHGTARLSISLSISDAICTSMTEAMVMGSLPIQSDTACADEWVEHGRSALLVNADDSDDVATAVERALDDDELVDSAAQINQETAKARLNAHLIASEIRQAYTAVVERARGRDGSRT
jgi:glycosyltransferase involved in cell wall biosynthesis